MLKIVYSKLLINLNLKEGKNQKENLKEKCANHTKLTLRA